MYPAERILRFPLFLLLSLSSCHIFFGDGVTSVTVTPANPTIAIGGMQQFIAHVTHKDGFTSQTTAALWTTSNPTVATINGRGLATGVSPGAATITATVNSVSGFTTLTVKSVTANAVAVQGGAGKLEVTFPATGQRYLYVANALEDAVAVYRVEPYVSDGQVLYRESLAEAVSVHRGHGPVWLAVHPQGRYLYVLNRASNSIVSFTIDPATGRLQPVVGSPFDCEGKAWTIAADAAGEFVEVTQSGSVEITRFRIDPYTGALDRVAQSR